MPRLAILSYSDGRFDARARRIARSAVGAGYTPVIYARWQPGLSLEEDLGGVPLVRVPVVLRMAIPGLRGSGRRRIASLRREARSTSVHGRAGPGVIERAATPRLGRVGASARTVLRVLLRPARAIVGPIVLFAIRPMAWAAALEEVAEPAELWHGMWAGSLPALGRLRARHGGRTVYDSRDVYLHARLFDRMHPILKDRYRSIERRWARATDLVVTVNDDYAAILVRELRIAQVPVVVRNCPDPYDPPDPPPNLIREVLGLSWTTGIVLYQGGLMTERGIEQAMQAILRVPHEATLVLMGYGAMREAFATQAATPPYRDRVALIDPVPPEALLAWTASSDVMLMAIQPTSLNHRYTTPQKLWEAIAAGVPVVASDLPGMAPVIDEIGCGITCDPTDPGAIASAIDRLLEIGPEERQTMRARIRDAARDRYNWHAQASVLFAAYDRLLRA